MAVADAIPMVGPLVGTLPVILIALTKGPTPAMIVVVAMIIYHQFENHILIPRIYGTTMQLSSTIIIIAILIGATLMGILGALLALPVAAAVPVVYRYVQEWRQREEEVVAQSERVLP
jgi:predicted PurR-regulated permease PerM